MKLIRVRLHPFRFLLVFAFLIPLFRIPLRPLLLSGYQVAAGQDNAINTAQGTDDGSITRVSVASDGTHGNLDSLGRPAISSNGKYIAFASKANNLVAGDTNNRADIFVRDQQEGKTYLISTSYSGGLSNGESSAPSISADGLRVAFVSTANNLIVGDTNNVADIFVYDWQPKQISIVSVTSDGILSDGESALPSISANGRYVAFESKGVNLRGVEHSSGSDVYVHNMDTRETSVISVGLTGYASGTSHAPSISADGRFVAFQSFDFNLVEDDIRNFSHNWAETFVRDRDVQETVLVSLTPAGVQSEWGSQSSTISANGRYVTFASSGIEAGSNVTRVFVRDLQSKKTSQVSVASDKAEIQANNADRPSISADGRYLAFSISVNALNTSLPPNNSFSHHIFVHDQVTGDTRYISQASDGTPGNQPSRNAVISADGQYVAFHSDASNLAGSNRFGRVIDVFVHYREIRSSTITGRIVDTTGKPVENALIKASFGQETLTGASGYYTFTNVMPGTHVLTPAIEGFTVLPISRTVASPLDTFGQDYTQCGNQAVANTYAPLMHFHKDDLYRPIHPAQAMPLVEKLTDGEIEAPLPVTLETLATKKWRTNPAAYLDFMDTDVYLNMVKSREIPTIFARIYCPKLEDPESADTRIAIQYWFFYYYDDWTNNHEGDWEMIQVVLTDTQALTTSVPYVAYSQHKPFGSVFKGGSKRWREYVEWSGTHPLVYVGNGSHASFFKPYPYYYSTGTDYTAPLAEGLLEPSVEMLPVTSEKESWLYFEGSWGNTSFRSCTLGYCGPPGPSQRGSEWGFQWDNALQWSDGLPWDELASHHNAPFKLRATAKIPTDIHVYDNNTARHVGWNNGSIELEIPTSEYFDAPVNDTRTIILHYIIPDPPDSKTPRYRIESRNRPRSLVNVRMQQVSNEPDLTLQYPDFTSNTAITTQYYFPDDWNDASKAVVDVYEGSAMNLKLDINGDGVVDREIPPASYTQYPVRIYLPLIKAK